MNQFLKLVMWLFIFALVFIIGFLVTYYYFDDAERKTRKFCNSIQVGESFQDVTQKGLVYDKNLGISADRKLVSLQLSSGVFTFAACNVEFQENKVVSKQFWVDK